MPTINRLPKKRKEEGSQRKEDTPMRLLRRKAYNSKIWRKLRDSYLKQNPLCANCLRNGKVVPAEDIHHKISPFKGGEINWTLLLDPENLESLCKECHGEEHQKENGHRSPQEIIDALDAFFSDMDNEDN